MAQKVLVMPGTRELDLTGLGSIASEFGWNFETAIDLTERFGKQDRRDIAAVCFYRDAVAPHCSWTDALRVLGSALPRTPLVPFHGFSEQVNWDELRDAGAFHSLWLPLKENEVRQCLGFVWQAQKRTRRYTHIARAHNLTAVQESAYRQLVYSQPARIRPRSTPYTAPSYASA